MESCFKEFLLNENYHALTKNFSFIYSFVAKPKYSKLTK